MKRFRSIRITAILLVMLLAFLTVPVSAFAASGMFNDNHTDTVDYCLHASDVTVLLSEFSTKSRAQLESDIVSASNFLFRIRNDAVDFSDWLFYTGSYSIDFSALTASASASGYSVTVTLPAITMFSPSTITFRVYVIDDTPQYYPVSYSFESSTPGRSLPAGVLGQLPVDVNAVSGSVIAPASSFSSVRDGEGEWTFSGWSPASQSVTASGITFTGLWVWTVLPTHSVSYRFVSGSSGRTLPAEVLAKLPSDTIGIDGDVVVAPGTFRAVESEGGFWRFHGWSAASQTITGGEIIFVGTWRWHAYSVSNADTPIPSPTESPAVTPEPSLTPTLAPESPAPTVPPIQVLEQADNNPPTPQAGESGSDGKAVIAQALIAAALGALVASQAAAVAGDVKVLNWYQAKKAAARRAKL